MDFVGSPAIQDHLAKLEDIQAIIELKHRYAQFCDDGYDPAIVELFAEDAIWSSQPSGRHQGREAIEDLFAAARSRTIWTMHFFTNPIIEVSPDAESARGTWLLLQLATMTAVESKQPDAVLGMGTYRDLFAKVAGRWLFQEINLHVHHITNLDQGWVKQPMRRRK